MSSLETWVRLVLLCECTKDNCVLRPGMCLLFLQEKIRKLTEKKKKGQDLLASIQRRKDFRNPRYMRTFLLFSFTTIEDFVVFVGL